MKYISTLINGIKMKIRTIKLKNDEREFESCRNTQRLPERDKVVFNRLRRGRVLWD